MRSIWKGAISFGLVTIPVKLYGATEERDVKFNQVRRSDGSRIRYKRVAAADGEEVEYGDIAKGFELPGGEMVVLTDDDFKDLPLTTSRVIDVLEFVPLTQIDPVYYAKTYYLEPEKNGVKPYVLLRDALVQSGQVALVKVALRQRESLAALRVRDDVFVLETMLWPDEVRAPDFPFLSEQVEVRPQELQMAQSLIETLAADFDPTQYADSYREALQALIDAKVEGHQVSAPVSTETGGGGAVLDLMAALRASVDAAKKGRPAGTTTAAADDDAPAAAPEPTVEEPVHAAKKAPAKKAPAAEAAAEAPAKRATAKTAPAKTATAKTATAKTATAKTAAKKSAVKAAEKPAAAKKSA